MDGRGGTLWFGGERREFVSGESQRAAGRRGEERMMERRGEDDGEERGG